MTFKAISKESYFPPGPAAPVSSRHSETTASGSQQGALSVLRSGQGQPCHCSSCVNSSPDEKYVSMPLKVLHTELSTWLWRMLALMGASGRRGRVSSSSGVVQPSFLPGFRANQSFPWGFQCGVFCLLAYLLARSLSLSLSPPLPPLSPRPTSPCSPPRSVG